jgi:hypothetical protein
MEAAPAPSSTERGAAGGSCGSNSGEAPPAAEKAEALAGAAKCEARDDRRIKKAKRLRAGEEAAADAGAGGAGPASRGRGRQQEEAQDGGEVRLFCKVAPGTPCRLV